MEKTISINCPSCNKDMLIDASQDKYSHLCSYCGFHFPDYHIESALNGGDNPADISPNSISASSILKFVLVVFLAIYLFMKGYLFVSERQKTSLAESASKKGYYVKNTGEHYERFEDMPKYLQEQIIEEQRERQKREQITQELRQEWEREFSR